jgi:hypothetical protein
MSWWDNLKSTLPNVKAGFDPAALGLTPSYSTSGSAEGGTQQQTLGAFTKDNGDGTFTEYDAQGNLVGVKPYSSMGSMAASGLGKMVKTVAPFAAAMYGGHLLSGLGAAGGATGAGIAEQIAFLEANGLTAAEIATITGVDAATAGAAGAAAAGAGGAAAAGAGGAASLTNAGLGAGAGAGLGSLLLPAAIAGSSILGANAAKDAAETQADAQKDANKLLYDMYQQQRTDLQPFVTAGTGAQNQLLTYLGLPGGAQGANFGKYARDFNQNDMVTDPGYAFRLSEGQKALDRQAAARGGLISGGALKAATRYGQDMGSQEYGNAFNRYQTNRQNQLSPLFSLMGSGQASAAGQAAAAGNYGTQGAAGLTNIGAANAAGTVGATNALTAGLGSYLNYSSNQDMVNALTRRTGYGVT